MSLLVLCSFLLGHPEVCQTIARLAQVPWADLELGEGQEGRYLCQRSEVFSAQAQDQGGLRKEVSDTPVSVVQAAEVVALVGEAVVELEGGRIVHQANLLLPWVHLP